MEHLVADLQGLLGREAVEEPDEADLIGEAQAIVVAAASGDLGQVFLRQRCFADHLPPREGKWHHGWSQSHQKKRTSF